LNRFFGVNKKPMSPAFDPAVKMISSFSFAEVKASAPDDEFGWVEGYGNVSGVRDRANEVVIAGAYGDMEKIKKEGFLAAGHEWGAAGIGYFEEVREDEKGLFFRAKFHSTDEAQAVRKVIQERVEAGKTVSFSIGYFVKKAKWVEVEEGKSDYYRELHEIEVVEISVVTVPANTASTLTDFKAGAGSRLEDHLEHALGVVEDLVTRFESFDSDRKQGLSPTNQERLSALKQRIDTLHAKGLPTPEVVEVPSDLAAFFCTGK
jgi:HK97 family phage prohead protease